eukprot:2391648-Rhodomonas_salina.2
MGATAYAHFGLRTYEASFGLSTLTNAAALQCSQGQRKQFSWARFVAWPLWVEQGGSWPSPFCRHTARAVLTGKESVLCQKTPNRTNFRVWYQIAPILYHHGPVARYPLGAPWIASPDTE